MRRALMTALIGGAIAAMPAAPALAGPTLVGAFDGNQCKGGDITTCYATGTAATKGLLTQVGAKGAPVDGGSPGILRADFEDSTDHTGSTTNFSDWITQINGGDQILHYSYTGSEVATYIGLFQGGSAVGCTAHVNCFNNTYLLFYDASGITSGTFDLTTLFNNPGISHVDLFDHGGALPEPASWALMLLGFGGIGLAARRRRKPSLAQIA